MKVQNCGERKRSRGRGGRLRKRNEDKGEKIKETVSKRGREMKANKTENKIV